MRRLVGAAASVGGLLLLMVMAYLIVGAAVDVVFDGLIPLGAC